jgi:hypothetical protein
VVKKKRSSALASRGDAFKPGESATTNRLFPVVLAEIQDVCVYTLQSKRGRIKVIRQEQ